MSKADLTPAGEVLAQEIRTAGPIPFRRFMEIALYHTDCGYYRTPHGRLGSAGDFYTASQMQPVFGRVIAAEIRRLRAAMGTPDDFEVVELGPGRGEMAESLAEFRYCSVDVDESLPTHFSGVVFANEFFDALPVNVVVRCGDTAFEMRVGFDEERFVWMPASAVECGDEEPLWSEEPIAMREELSRIASALKRGYLLALDYGLTQRERIRFPRGTLMSYRRHQPLDDVLMRPGVQDITAHVPFDELINCGAQCGLHLERNETLAQLVLRIGEHDEFRDVLHAETHGARQAARLQLKTLFAGMGETFRAVLLKKEE
jgi:SAM-dependent MidA family methyltransferase